MRGLRFYGERGKGSGVRVLGVGDRSLRDECLSFGGLRVLGPGFLGGQRRS